MKPNRGQVLLACVVALVLRRDRDGQRSTGLEVQRHRTHSNTGMFFYWLSICYEAPE